MEKNEKECTVRTHMAEADKSEYPEGGRGWLVILGVFSSSAMTYGMINTYGVYATQYENSFPNTSSVTLNWIGSLQTFLCYFVAPFSFPLVSALSPRLTTFLGGALMMSSFFILSICANIWQIYLCQGLMYGIGAGFCFSSSLVSPYEWFKAKRALAIGLSVSGTSVGGIISTLILKRSTTQKGVARANIYIGCFYIPLVIMATCLIQQKLPGKYLLNKPEYISNSSPSFENLKGLKCRYLQMFAEWREVAKSPDLWLLLVSNIFGMLGSYPSIFYIDYYASLIAPDSKFAEFSIIIWHVCGGVGRILNPFLADKYGRLNILIVAIFFCSILPVAMWIPSRSVGDALYGVFISLYSFSCGGFFSVFPSTMGQIFGIRGAESRVNLFSLTSSIGPLVGGAIAASFIPDSSKPTGVRIESFTRLIIYTSCVMFASCIVLTYLKFRLFKNWNAFV